MKNQSIGVLTVATNIYLEYWKNLVNSAESVTDADQRVTFFVFTDNLEEVNKFSATLEKIQVVGFEIPSYGWPEATLLRYKIFESRLIEIQTNILIHLDADMIIIKNPWDRIKWASNLNEISLVRHPGFWRPKSMKRILFYLSRPKIFYHDLRLIVQSGGLGTWETNTKSTAFVPRSMRKKYFCGGTWFGSNVAIAEMIGELSLLVDKDLAENLIAVWHDESHLNRWSSQNNHRSESPELCFDETYEQLKTLSPWIIAVRKKAKTR